MRRLPLFSAMLVLSLAMGAPKAIAHAGHGDEFQATGGVNRVEVNAETDPLLGIQVTPIESVTDSNAVLIPVTALVDDNGRQLVFVQHENFYEPVDVTTGETQGDLIEITNGLSVGEQLVSQGSLSLYAESRKTQTAEEAPVVSEDPSEETSEASVGAEAEPLNSASAEQEPETEAPAIAQNSTSEDEPAPSSAQATDKAPSSGFPWGIAVGIGALAALGVGGAAVMNGRRSQADQ